MTAAATTTLYGTLAERLRRDILSGALAPGQMLPSEMALTGRHNLSRGTVRQAIGELVAEGLVVSLNGRGHQVRSATRLAWRASDPERYDPSRPAPRSDSWRASVCEQGRTPAEHITTEIAYASERVAQWLALPPGTPVSVRRRLRTVDGEPYSTADSYYPRSIVSGTEVELPADVQPGIYSVFERLGRPWVSTIDTWISRAPSREESVSLRIPRGISVAEIVRRSFDPDGVPVRLTFFVMPGDRHEITYIHPKAEI